MTAAVVRPETAGDRPAVDRVLAAAFRREESPQTPAPEVALVAALRLDPAWIPPLSLVADIDGEVVGHVLCTRATIGGTAALALGPLAVIPGRQGEGIGTWLVQAVIVAAALSGEPVICLLGSPDYYSRFGFVAAEPLGIEAPDPAWGAAFQALVAAGTVVPQGRFAYAAPFTELS